MTRIQVLPKEVCNQIAAGEVIEHPCSILRELLDNSIDSGATSIFVRLFEESLEEFVLEVTDNGCGIFREDLPLSFFMHATSKIQSFEDIYHLQTMGFRGEALASIASVSHVQIVSSTANTGEGFSIFCEGGETSPTSLVSAPQGTKVSVSKIFFNTPARKKFLSGKILNKDLFRQEFIRKALSIEKVGFSLEVIIKGKIRQDIRIPSGATFLERISLLFAGKFDQNLLEVNVTEQRKLGRVFMQGYMSDLQIRNRTRKDQYFFVRSRYVQNLALYKSIQSAYATFLPQKSYPICFLKIMCETNMIDVNVHPTKKDIRFEDGSSMYSLVYQGVKKTLSDHMQVRLYPFGAVDVGVTERPQQIASYSNSVEFDKGGSITFPQDQAFLENKIPTVSFGFETSVKKQLHSLPILERETYGLQKFPLEEDVFSTTIRIVGQYNNTYIIFEKENNLLVADQHALHERMLFEQYQERFSQGIEKQTLLIPFVAPFEGVSQENLSKYCNLIESLGIELEIFGTGLCKIESVPLVLGYTWNENSIKDLLELILDNLGQSVEEITRRISASLSCWNSVKVGESLPDWKSLELVRDFYKKEYVATCPHGRPIIKEWSEMEIKRYFYRDYPS